MKNIRAIKIGVFFIFAVVLISSAVAQVDYEYDVDDPTSAAAQIELTYSGLSPSQTYQFGYIDGTGSFNSLQSVESLGNGFLILDFNADPFDNGVALEPQGWHYQLRANGSSVSDTYMSWSMMFQGVDSFVDGIISHDYWDECNQDNLGFTENIGGDGYLEEDIGSAGSDYADIGYKRRLNVDQGAMFWLRTSKTGSSFDNRNVYLKFGNSPCRSHLLTGDSSLQNGTGIFLFGQGGSSPNVPSERFKTYYNESSNEWTVTFMNNTVYKTVSSGVSELDDYYITFYMENIDVGSQFRIRDFSTPPKSSIGDFNISDLTGEDHASFNPSGRTVFSVDNERLKRDGNPGIIYGGDGVSSVSFSNFPLIEEFAAWNTQNGTTEALAYDIDEKVFLELRNPDDNSVFVGGSSVDFEVLYDVPQNFEEGSIELEYRKEGSSTWSLLTDSWTSNAANCFPASDNDITNGCVGDIITFSRTQLRLEGPGQYEWRVKYTNEEAETAANQGQIFTSDSRNIRLLSAFKRIRPISPLNGTTVVTATPTFSFNLDTDISGEASLLIDNSSQNTWTIADEFEGTLSENVSVSEGDHTWRARFIGDDSDTATTEPQQFTVNTSLRNAVNFTLEYPPDSAKLKDRDVDLVYDVENAESGTLRVFLNGVQRETQELSPGFHDNLTTSLIQVRPAEHSWTLLFETDSGIKFQSDTNGFTVLENVTLLQVSPSDGAKVDQPPILFEAQVDTSSGGELRLVVDDTVRASKNIASGFNGTTTLKVSKNITAGKHSWSLEFESFATREVFETGERTFDLAIGSKELRQVGGQLASIAEQTFGELFGTDAEESLMVVAMMFIIGFTIITAAATTSPMVGMFSGLVSYVVFALIGWLPQWTLAVVVILAGAVLARKISQMEER